MLVGYYCFQVFYQEDGTEVNKWKIVVVFFKMKHRQVCSIHK